jgi:hypothetical protein
MESILLFAQTISPLGVIALLVIVILQLVRNTGIVGRLRGTQTKKVSADTDSFDILNTKLDKIMVNHLHELPRLVETVDRIEIKLNAQGERLVGVETAIKYIVK